MLINHRKFVMGLKTYFVLDKYVFVHGGLKPGIPLHKQKAKDIIWIRDEFLYSDFDFGFTVIHGHTPCIDPEIKSNRINLDTGAFKSNGKLTCMCLETKKFYFSN